MNYELRISVWLLVVSNLINWNGIMGDFKGFNRFFVEGLNTDEVD
ncbi:MAG TPA: hypothetical protein P5335_05415 [Flavobacterium sp.]|nr:hypothetical protein [Flavobacterium sp.]